MSALLLTLLACGLSNNDNGFGDDILPKEEQLLVNLPIASEAAKSPDDPTTWASFYDTTRNVTENVNGMITFVLGTTWLVVHTQEPSWTDEAEQTAMWGPYKDSGLDPVSTGVWVKRNDDESWSWSLFQVPNGGTVEADAVAIVLGEVDAGSTRDDASGRFVIDFDAAAALDPSVHLVGKFASEYDYDAEGVSALAMTEGYGLDVGPRYDAIYDYDEDYTGAGEMDLAYLADLNASGTDEVVTLKSRWQADGMGRGDARILDGDLKADEVTASECWGTDFLTSYWVDSIDLHEPVGEESVCAFTPASYAEEASFSTTD
jgi:hypothetical protein